MATAQEQLDAISTALDAAGQSLANISNDEAAQAAQIQKLIDQINAGTGVTADQLQPLVDKSNALAAAMKGVADSIPDVTPPTP